MTLRFTRRALRHLDQVRTHIAPHDPAVANRIIARIRKSIEGLIPDPLD